MDSHVDREGDGKTATAFAKCVEELKQTRLTCQRALKKLSFDSIHRREDTIMTAHTDTFSWVFDEDTTEFPSWASNKDGELPYLNMLKSS